MERGKREKRFVERRKNNHDALVGLIPELNYWQRNARGMMTVMLMASDALSLLAAYALALWLRMCLMADCDLLLLQSAVYILLLFLMVYSLHGLYPGVGLSPVDEMRRLFGASNIVFLLLIGLNYWLDRADGNMRFMLAATWLLVLVLVQGNRWLTRIIGRRLDMWGEPVAVVGSGSQGKQIEKFLNERLRLGMRPVLAVDGRARYEDSALAIINRSGIRTVILVTAETSAELQEQFVNNQRYGYYRRRGEKPIQRLILISQFGRVSSLGVQAHDLDGMLGLEVRQNLLNKFPNILKRSMDLILTVAGGLAALPGLLLIAGLICLDSPGGVFYRQERIGRDGKHFRMWKFRSMQADAEQVLKRCLEADAALQNEWDKTQKLKDDPRITRVGKFLRRYSLDEIPQLINVMKGEMSLVGPRPYFPDQEALYSASVKLYQRVRPGMTGMWQVRGRNTTSFSERARLDEYYVRNWSVWLDIYILLRTVLVVMAREGAY